MSGDYVNIRNKEIDNSKIIYLTVPFAEYYGWQEIRDKIVSFLNSKKQVVFVDEIVRESGLRAEIVASCLTYLIEKDYVNPSAHHRQNQRVNGYTLTKQGRLYAEVIGS